ncbi:MAG: hypothetical protein JST80_05845 [Bdellovibrionales bacterium]|nr:hypothetical protein [Bdellovibrionales bacterium]
MNLLKKSTPRITGLVTLILLVLSSKQAEAGFFNLEEFVDYQSWAVGMEPEITLNQGGGFATNFKFTYGITPLSNFQAGIGFGGGARGFRIGGAYTFDFIPDLDGQIGAGLALTGYYYKLRSAIGETEFSIAPYIHNAFQTRGGVDFDPYISLPLGMAFSSGTYVTTFQLVMGSYFPTSQHFGVNAELGVQLKDSSSYISFGMTYRD